MADHGPGTSGGGMTVQSGETLKAGKISMEWRSDYTAFKVPSDAEIRAKAEAAGDIDLLDHSLLHSLNVGYGLTDTFQLSATMGYYSTSGGATASFDPNTSEITRAANRPNGLTDTWLQAKWAFYKGPAGRFAAIAGLKLPTGKKGFTDSEGNPVDYASTPGSGAADTQAGVGYSTFLTSNLTLDASFSHTWRGTYRGTRLGDRTDTGMALAYRLTDDIRSFPQFGVFTEVNFRSIGKVLANGELDDNSGGRAFFMSPGFRCAVSPKLAFTLAGQLPLHQAPNGAQIETKFKAVAAVSLTF